MLVFRSGRVPRWNRPDGKGVTRVVVIRPSSRLRGPIEGIGPTVFNEEPVMNNTSIISTTSTSSAAAGTWWWHPKPVAAMAGVDLGPTAAAGTWWWHPKPIVPGC